VRDYGPDDSFPIGDIDDILPGLLERCSRVHYAMGVHQDFDQRVIGWVNSLRAMAEAGRPQPAGVRRARPPAARHASL
jgi:Xaa-Pro aminopeptidase